MSQQEQDQVYAQLIIAKRESDRTLQALTSRLVGFASLFRDIAITLEGDQIKPSDILAGGSFVDIEKASQGLPTGEELTRAWLELQGEKTKNRSLDVQIQGMS